MLEEIHAEFKDFSEIVKEGKTYEERKELFWRCYAVNPKKEEIEKMSLSDMVDYIKDTDQFYEDDKKYIDKCIKLIEEMEEK